MRIHKFFETTVFPLSSVELYLLKKALDHKTTDEEHLRLHLHQPLLSFWLLICIQMFLGCVKCLNLGRYDFLG